MTPLYTSHMQFFVSTRDTGSTAEAFQGSQFSQERVASYARLLDGEEIAGRVVARLGLDMSPVELSQRIAATAAIDTVLIDVDVTDPSPELAQRIAEVLGDEFVDLVAELETPAGRAAPLVDVTVTDRPEVADEPSEPQVPRNIALGVTLGLLKIINGGSSGLC